MTGPALTDHPRARALPLLEPAPGLDPAWSRFVRVPDGRGGEHVWHVLDTAAAGRTGEADGEADGDAGPALGTLLCVHGNPTWSYLWRRLLAAAPPGWRVVAVDQLGMGWSERPAAARTLAQRVDDLARLTDALGLTGPGGTGAVVTVAHDWGGPVSLGWALAHRPQLAGVVLLNTAVHQPAGSPGPALIRAASMPGVRELVCVRTPTFVRAATALSRPALPAAVRDAYAAPYRTAARRTAVGDFVADIPFVRGHPSASAVDAIAEGVRGLDVPALLLWGPRDPVFGEAHLRDLRRRLPQAQLHRYEGASHLLPEDAPAYPGDVADWLRNVVEPGLGRPAAARTGSDGAPRSAAATRRIAAPGSRPLWSHLDDRRDDTGPALLEVGGVTVTWRQLHHRVRALAGGLVRAGLRPGDRVALLVPPSAELTAAVYAVWRAGGVVVVADRGLGLRGMGRALRAAAVDHVIGTPAGLAAARAMRLPGQRYVVGTARALPGTTAAVADLVRSGAGVPLPDVPDDADCAVVFTSGATGPAKGVAYRHRQVQAQVELIRATYRLGADDRLVAAFAPFAIYGPALGVASCVPDVDVTAPGTLTAAALADAVSSLAATVVFASPAALRNVVATRDGLDEARRAALAGVRLLMSAGAPMPVPLLRDVARLLPSASPRTPYGMTEALPVTDVSLAELEAAGPGDGVCVGRPLAGVEVRVAPLSPSGRADGEPTSRTGVTGEICVRAPHVKDRYDALWATERRSSRDPGWHRTGDVGFVDDDGRLWVQGRLVHVVTTAAGPVAPVGPEQRVERLPEVAAAAVVGVGPAGAQAVVVVVVPDAGAAAYRHPGRRRSRRARGLGGGRSPVADLALADRVRAAAGVPVAAVLVRDSLPVDIRHASKVDRSALAQWADRTLAGG